MLPLPLTQCLNADLGIQRCRSDPHGRARRFHACGGSLEVGISFHGVVNERGQLGVTETANPVRHDNAATMRPGPSAGNLRASRLGHDVFAHWRLLNRATRKCEARSGAQNDSAIHVSERVLMEFPNEPVELRRNSQEDFAHDVDHFALLSINGTATAGTSSEEKLTIVRRKNKAYRDA